MEFNKLYNKLVEEDYFTEEELRLVTDINGNTVEVLNDCIYARYGYRTFEDLVEG